MYQSKIGWCNSGTPSKLTAWQSKYNIPEKNCYNYENFDAIKNNPDIDVVYIITPNALHKDEAIRVAKAGKHVICEKPMALNAKEGEMGKVFFFQGLTGFRIGDPTQWRLNIQLAGGSSLMDIGIYAVNGARYMVGEDTVWVTAQETKTDPVKFKEGVDEIIQFQFGFPSGAVASCLSTYMMTGLDRFYLNAEKGFAEMLPSTG